MKRTTLLIIFLSVTMPLLKAQIIETDPGIPTKGQAITIYFNSDRLDETDDLYMYEGELYAHTGLTIDGARWQNVIESWGNNTTQPKLDYLGNYRYKLEISPDIEHFYPDASGNPVTPEEQVSEICLVIRDASASLQTRPDYFIEVFEAGLKVNITSPADRSVVINRYTTLGISVSASQADSVKLFIDDQEVKKEVGADQLDYTEFMSEPGGAWVRAIAYKDPAFVVDSFYYYVPGLPVEEALPEGTEDGINYVSGTEVILVVTAPGKSRAFVTGDFNDWLKNDDSYMKVTPDGEKFWKQISGLTPGKEYRYQYLVDDVTIADPYTEKVLDPWNDGWIDDNTYPGLIDYPEGLADDLVGILQTDAPGYDWKTTAYTRPGKSELIIYELLIRDFLEAHNYANLIDTIDYLADLGVNAIELMPVSEFDGNESWGYNPSLYFAPDKYYGTGDKLKEFVDSCHARGIAVIIDMVLNHATGNSPLARLYWDESNNRTAADNPWFNVIPTHDFNVFHDFNHESEYTRYYAKRVMTHWIEEYRIDGYRFDLSKGFTQNNTLGNTGLWGLYDASRVAIWKMYADHIWSVDPQAYVILEHFAENSEEKELAEYGMLLWSNLNYTYRDLAKGASSDISWASWKTRGWNVANNVTYMESHDEERMMYTLLNEGYQNSSGTYNIRQLNTALERVAMSAVLFFTIPGPHMLWQFGELGYDYNIDYNGRTGNKPIRWDYLSVPERKALYSIFSEVLWLRRNHEVFGTDNFSITQDGMTKTIHLYHSSMDAVVTGNTGVSTSLANMTFPRTGWWYEYFSGDSVSVSGSSLSLSLAPGDYRIYTSERIKRHNTTGIYDDIVADNSWFTVYPNPVKDIMWIQNQAGNVDIDRLEVLDFDGRVVLSANNPADGPLDLSSLDPGMYILRISAGNKYGLKRIIKSE